LAQSSAAGRVTCSLAALSHAEAAVIPDTFIFMLVGALKLRQHVKRRPCHIIRKSISIHGAPVTSATSKIWLRSSSRSRRASSCGAKARAAFNISCRQDRKPARAGLIEAKEPDRLADEVIFQLGRNLLAHFDR